MSNGYSSRALTAATDGWALNAACVGEPTVTFFPEQWVSGTIPGRPDPRYAKARLICARCPVREECLAYAQSNSIPHGMWGGLTPRERRSNKANLRREGERSERCAPALDAPDPTPSRPPRPRCPACQGFVDRHDGRCRECATKETA